MDILMDIHVQHLDIYIGIWDIYMPSIIPQPLATDPSHGRAKIAAIYFRCLLSTTTTYRLFWQEAQIWAPVPRQSRCPAGAGPRCPARTGPLPARKSMSVAYWGEYQKAYLSFRSTGRGNGATGVHRTFSDGYQGKSIENSQMDPTEGRREGGTVPWRPFRAFPDGHQGRAHRAFSNGPHRWKQEHKMHSETVCAAGNSHACFAHVIEISSRIIAGVPARKPMSASTKRKSEKCISRTQD